MRITRSQLKRIINEEVRNYPSIKRSLREDLGQTSAGAWAEWAEACAEEMAKAVPTPTAKGGSDPEREEETKMHGLGWKGDASGMMLKDLVNWITDSSGDLMIGKGGPEFTVEEAKKVGVDVEFPDDAKKGKIGKRSYEERQALHRFITKWSNILWATGKFLEKSSTILNSYGRKISVTKDFILTQATGAQLGDLLGDANSKETAAEWISIVEPKLLEITKNNLDISEDAKGLKPEAQSELKSALKDLRQSVTKELAAAGYTALKGTGIKESRAHSHSPGSNIIVERWQRLAGILKG